MLDPDSSERETLLKEAALKPTLHRELWEEYNSSLPPSNRVISEYLKYKRNFNPAAVEGFVQQFRDTIAFANLTESDKIASVEGQSQPGGSAPMEVSQQAKQGSISPP